MRFYLSQCEYKWTHARNPNKTMENIWVRRELGEELRRVPQRRIIQTGRVPPEAVQLDDVVPRQQHEREVAEARWVLRPRLPQVPI